MQQVFRAYGQYRSVRGNLSGLPSWGKPILTIAALPGIVCFLISGILLIVLFLVSILALLLLTVPVYRVLKAIGGTRAVGSEEVGGAKGEEVFVQTVEQPVGPIGPRRQVEVKILDE